MSIRIEQLRPHPLSDQDLGRSELWDKELEFKDGERILVRAASGSGKTTFLSILHGSRSDYKGAAYLDERPIGDLTLKELPRIRREVLGMVFQDLKLFDTLSIGENLLLKNRMTGHHKEDTLRHMLGRLGLGDRWNDPVGQLSTGQKQRVAIIRGLCQPFRFLLLDEPFSHLDPENVRKACELIDEKVRKQGAGLILASLEDPYDLEYDKVLQL